MAQFTARDKARRQRLTLRHIESLGLDWRRGRFGDYVQVIQEFPKTPPKLKRKYPDPAQRQRLIFEAGSQLMQLICAAQIWARLDQVALKAALEKVLKGTAIPTKDHDPSRDTLLELACAAFCSEYGLRVDLTGGGEDVIVIHPEFGRGAVECKRPLKPESLDRCIDDLGRQLKKRLVTNDLSYGIAALGIDRVLGIHDDGSFPFVESYEEEEETTSGMCFDFVKEILPALTDSVWPYATVGMIFLSGAVLIQPAGHVQTFSTCSTFEIGGPLNRFTSDFHIWELLKRQPRHRAPPHRRALRRPRGT